MNTKEITAKFKNLFGTEPLLVRAPGRINLIGEHTDYNDGYVLPAAINLEMIFAIAPNNTDQCQLHAINLDENFTFPVQQPSISKTHLWANNIQGVVNELHQLNHFPKGFDCVFGGNIPMGSGLSSSAALECGMAFALNQLFDFHLTKLQIAQLSQQAEHNYVGTKCGIMDQFASTFGKANHIIQLDCRSLDYKYVKLDLSNYTIALVNTMVAHDLATSEYNTRRLECEQGVTLLQKYYPNIKSLRDVSITTLQEHQHEIPTIIYKRCQYVIEENNRLLDACVALENEDLNTFGKHMYNTHQGLSELYNVSCPELDFLVHQSKKTGYVVGARVMGGGFGGCTINLVETQHLETFKTTISQAYQTKFNRTPEIYMVSIENGVGVVGLN